VPGRECISLVVVGQKQQRGGTIVDNHVLIPIMQTILNVVPIVRMVIVVGDGNGDGGGGNNGGGVNPCL
jgi:hypothetical protein